MLGRFVEALLVAGRPSTALAVQRARCAGSSSSSSLAEAVVLLKVQLGCGLLAEAFSELHRHCSQVCDVSSTTCDVSRDSTLKRLWQSSNRLAI